MKNELSWSNSRRNTFEQCKKRYFRQYYQSWGGWYRTADETTRFAYRLKNLTGRAAWAGTTVHDMAKETLKAMKYGRSVDHEKVLEEARQHMRTQFKISQDKLFLHAHKKTFGLMEHAYGEDVPNATWKENWNNVVKCYRNFLDSGALSRAREAGTDGWVEIDSLSTFHTPHIKKVFAAPDFGFKYGAGQLEIVDWKTGKKRKGEDKQLHGYAAYAVQKLGATPGKIRGTLAYLKTGEEVSFDITQEDLDNFQEMSRVSHEEMKAILDNVELNQASEENFPMAEDTFLCGWCPFRTMCFPEEYKV